MHELPPAVQKMYDLTLWLVSHAVRFPRSHKYLLGDRIATLALDTHDLLVQAAYSREKITRLRQVNLNLERLRHLSRLCMDSRLFSVKQHAYVAQQINEVGVQVGGWLKQQEKGAK